jgi:hypothetical protein
VNEATRVRAAPILLALACHPNWALQYNEGRIRIKASNVLNFRIRKYEITNIPFF